MYPRAQHYFAVSSHNTGLLLTHLEKRAQEVLQPPIVVRFGVGRKIKTQLEVAFCCRVGALEENPPISPLSAVIEAEAKKRERHNTLFKPETQ